ncbi:MAG: alpha/beta fold hydrolase [Pseudonocardiaceae bacterium]
MAGYTLRTSFHFAGSVRMYAVHWRQSAPPTFADVVLVHGMVVAGRGTRPLADALAREGLTVHVPDLPGFGRSDKPRHALDVNGLAGHLAAWMTACGLGKLIVIGNSFGTQVAAALATSYPAAVAGLVLLSPTIDPRLRRWVPLGALPTGCPGGSPATGIWAGMQRRLRDHLIPAGLPAKPADLRSLITSEYAAAGPLRALSTYRYCLLDDIEDRTPNIRCPTIILRAQDDGLVSARWGRSLASRVPEGRYCEVPGADHDAQFKAPEAVARALMPVLRS